MKWFKYESQSYMDPKPEVGFHTFENPEAAQAWAKRVQDNRLGTCRILGYAKKEEILAYIQKYNLNPDEVTWTDINNSEFYE